MVERNSAIAGLGHVAKSRPQKSLSELPTGTPSQTMTANACECHVSNLGRKEQYSENSIFSLPPV
jgi:hypothetical protein